MSNEFIFELTTPIKYHDTTEGVEVEASFITLFAPTFKVMERTAPLKQSFFRAMASLQDDEKEQEPKNQGEEQELTPEALISLLYQSDEDMFKVLLHAVALFRTKGVAKVQGTVDLNALLIEQLGQDQLEEMLGQYMVNFILASVLSNQKKKSDSK